MSGVGRTNAWRGRLSAWWAQRSERERWLLLGMAVAAAAYAATVGVVRPLLSARDEARASIARSDAALAQLDALPDGGVPRRADSSGQPVTAVVTETAAEFGMTIRRIEPEAGGASLAIEDADFAAVMQWIEALETAHGLRLTAVKMDRRTEPGRVDATLTVQR